MANKQEMDKERESGSLNLYGESSSVAAALSQNNLSIDLNAVLPLSGMVVKPLIKSGDLMLLMDISFTFLVLFIAEQARHILPLGVTVLPSQQFINPVIYLLVLGIWVITFHAYSVYDPAYQGGPFDIGKALIATVTSGLILAGVLYLSYRDLPRFLYIYFIIGDLLALSTSRLIVRNLAVRFNWYRRRVFVVGREDIASEIAQMVHERKGSGLDYVGYIAEETILNKGEDISVIENIIRKNNITDMIFTVSPRQQKALSSVLQSMQRLPVQLRIVPDYFDLTTRMKVDNFSGMPMVSLNDAAITGVSARIKRAIDVICSLLALIVLAPLMLIITVAIRLDSKGPAIFRQRRIGQHHRVFTILKFRSMVIDAEEQAASVIENQGDSFVHKKKSDPRITRVGAFLRKTSLDELPQLINVLFGDMSLVGPRPELPWIVAQYEPWQYRRLVVPQGITGWWQVSGRSNKVLHLHTEDDLYYIRNYSIWLDIKILLATVKVVITGRGAF